MTQFKPFLFLQRLVIVSNKGTVAYDEKFHLGTNIIRGQNSSGKSTIANFIFYALGGDHYKWTDAANENREIFAEVNANGAILTLKRGISPSPMQSMAIFWGPYELSIQSNFEGWSHYPYKETSGKGSFTNVLFEALDMPQFRSETDSKITMHQLLRLIFIDQESPSQNLFRFERFDQPLTRQTVSEILLGVYDDTLYRQRLEIRELEKSLTEKQYEVKSLGRIFGPTGKKIDLGKLQKDLESAYSELNKTEAQIDTMKSRKSVTLSKTAQPEILKFQEEFQDVKETLGRLTNEIRSTEVEIFDSEQFVESLENRISALRDSARTKQILGELPFEFCPQCFRPLGEHASNTGCVLCKTPFEENFEVTFAKRLQQEIQLQVKESRGMLEKKKRHLLAKSSDRARILERYRILQESIDSQSKRMDSTRDDKLDQLLVKKGNLQSSIEFLNEKIQSMNLLVSLEAEIEDLQKTIGKLQRSIRLATERQQTNLNNALSKIQEITLKILRLDLSRQTEFSTGSMVDVDFFGDVFSLDGHHNFSASSNVLLKNSVRFAIFFASLELPFFRYPRLVICDNIEDKGMEQERSQNFQRIIVDFSKSYDVEHQIIFTTSMIADELNIPEITVGDFYTEGHKSLKS